MLKSRLVAAFFVYNGICSCQKPIDLKFSLQCMILFWAEFKSGHSICKHIGRENA